MTEAERRRVTAAQRRAHDRRYPPGTPVVATWQTLDRDDLSPAEEEMIVRCRREAQDPATVADLVKLSSEQRLSDDEVALDVINIKRAVKWTKVILGILLPLALTGAGAAVKSYLAGVEAKGELKVTIEHLQDEVRELRAHALK